MLNCFKTKVNETYPALVYSVYYNNSKGLVGYKAVFELEEDAKQYCLDNTSQVYMIVTQNFIPPTYEPADWPNLAYPMFYTETDNNMRYTFYKCFVSARDAEDYMNTNSNKNATFGYSNCYYYPSGSFALSKSKDRIFKPIAPYEVIVPTEQPEMKR